MKLYTRSGDDGSTGLFGGGRVPKHHPRVEAYGNIDELNATIGWALCAITEAGKTGVSHESDVNAALSAIHSILTTLQSRLFDLGADLATPPESKQQSKIHRIDEADIAQSEKWIDEIDGGNSPITSFILPGGSELAARLHIARAVCRRAERAMVHLSQTDEVNPHAIVFINRISDLLFAMARRANKELGVNDVEWLPAKR